MTPQDLAHWNQYDVFLFDIDGTLLHATDAVHYFAFCEALSGVAGRPVNLDGVVAHGNVDNGILRDAFALADVPEGVWRPRLPALQDGMCRFVEQRTSDFRIEVLPVVEQVLAGLRAQGKLLGVATGNLERIGRAKLRRAGLLECFDFGGYSDACEYRRDVFAGAVAQARALAGPQARICAVGDTPEDVRAAQANGLDVIAVATGIYSLEALAAEHPTFLLRSLAELPLKAFSLTSQVTPRSHDRKA